MKLVIYSFPFIVVNPLMFQGGGTDAGGIIFLHKYKGKSEFEISFYKLNEVNAF